MLQKKSSGTGRQERIERIKNIYPDEQFECFSSGDELIEKADVDAVIIAFSQPVSTSNAMKIRETIKGVTFK